MPFYSKVRLPFNLHCSDADELVSFHFKLSSVSFHNLFLLTWCILPKSLVVLQQDGGLATTIFHQEVDEERKQQQRQNDQEPWNFILRRLYYGRN